MGLTLAAHGTQKPFGWFGGPGLNTTGQFFTVLNFPPGVVADSTLVIVTQGVSTPVAQASVTQTLRRTDKGWRIARRLIKEAAEGGCGA